MTPTPELAIRLTRAAFNKALATRDLNAIGPILAPQAILIAGTDSALISGRKAQLMAWKREFAAPDRSVYQRTPDTITVSPVEPIALEQGSWQGISVSGGHMVASGIYSAKWRQIGSVWMIEGELYLTLG
jgi:ketosteroid isomerase-like protein